MLKDKWKLMDQVEGDYDMHKLKEIKNLIIMWETKYKHEMKEDMINIDAQIHSHFSRNGSMIIDRDKYHLRFLEAKKS